MYKDHVRFVLEMVFQDGFTIPKADIMEYNRTKDVKPVDLDNLLLFDRTIWEKIIWIKSIDQQNEHFVLY